MIYKESFETAKENMAFDEALLKQFSKTQNKDHYFRHYTWKNPGITYSYKQSLPNDLIDVDHAKRITGGGIVFHAPGDKLMTLIGYLNDPLFPKGLKEKMKILLNCFDQQKFHPDEAGPSNKIHNFCSHYHNPYELKVEHNKVFAQTIRKYKNIFIIQAIHHRTDGTQYFPKKYHSYFFKKQIR
jgi:lipoate-protein ligase A